MGARHVGRSFSIASVAALAAGLVLAVACGTPNSVTGGPDASEESPFDNGMFSDEAGGAGSCTPLKCTDRGYECGINSDGCGNTMDCGSCPSGQQCGAGGFSKCGNPNIAPDGGTVSCTSKSCSELGFDCGKALDNCGSIVDCGPKACSGGNYCGGGGPEKCGGAPDGGAVVDGGAGGGKDGGGSSKPDAGGTTCVPATCASLKYNCGYAGDGCGGMIGPCGTGTCPTGQSCGVNSPNVCGSPPCTGVCSKVPACAAGKTTTLKGTVRAGLQEGATSWVPAGTTPDPVPGVLVYIPQKGLSPFESDPSHPIVQCQSCGADVSGDPLVSTTTAFDGTFTLSGVPVSASASDTIPVVIQLGRWRRQFNVAITTPCGDNTAPDFHLPSTSAEGDIPLTAISTGSYDSIECVLLKMGVSQSEFTSYPTWAAEAASGTSPKPGRVHIYTSTQAAQYGIGPGATLAPQEDETVLMGSGNNAGPANGTYMMYDQILLPCWGDAFTKSPAELANLIAYGNSGGRFFATHYSYSWLLNNGVLNGTAQWDPKADPNDTNPFPTGVDFTGSVSTTVPTSNPGLFVKWLNQVGALNGSNPGGAPPANPTVTIHSGRHDVDNVLGASSEWIQGTDPAPAAGDPSQMLLHFTFDMPIGKSGQCGHAIYSDFHVNGNTSNGQTFPNECDQLALTPQERILEYMIWDLASCVPTAPPSACAPKTCAEQGITCGPAGDTCGNLIPGGCGSCPTGQACGAGGKPGVCGPTTSNGGGGGDAGTGTGGGSCKPLSCQDQNITCGPAADGCGDEIDGGCGGCPPPAVCGGGGVPGQCGTLTSCVPMTCAQENVNCGVSGDGCGGVTPNCGTCSYPETCGGGGVPGQCGRMMVR